jgi:Protein of unknown function (DUF3102)
MSEKILAREAAAIRQLKKRATARGKQLLGDLIEIGKRLDRAKEHVGHGNWTPWLQKNFQWSADTASNYMRVHALSQTPEFRRLRNLPLDALYLLGRKSVTADVRAEVAERVEAGEAVTVRTLIVPTTQTVVPVTSVYVSPPEEPDPCFIDCPDCGGTGIEQPKLDEPEPEIDEPDKVVPEPRVPPQQRAFIIEVLRSRIAELEHQKRQLETRVIGLESENAELRARLGEASPRGEDDATTSTKH